MLIDSWEVGTCVFFFLSPAGVYQNKGDAKTSCWTNRTYLHASTRPSWDRFFQVIRLRLKMRYKQMPGWQGHQWFIRSFLRCRIFNMFRQNHSKESSTDGWWKESSVEQKLRLMQMHPEHDGETSGRGVTSPRMSIQQYFNGYIFICIYLHLYWHMAFP